MKNSSTVVPLSEINSFIKVYYEVYNEVNDEIRSLSEKNEPFMITPMDSIKARFEQKYNVTLLESDEQPNKSSMLLGKINAIDFKTEENMTMCMLKWG